MSDNPQQSQTQPQPQPLQQTQSSNNQNQDLESCDLANLESLNVNDSDELLRQLTENTFELETFFSEFSTADIKVNSPENSSVKTVIKNFFSQEENNNDADCVQVSSNQNQQTNFLNDNELNVEANVAILQNRLLMTAASNKFGITLMKGKLL